MGSKLPAFRPLFSQFPSLPLWFPPLDVATGFLFLLVPTTLGILLPTLSNPASRRVLIPLSLVPAPCPLIGMERIEMHHSVYIVLPICLFSMAENIQLMLLIHPRMEL